MWRNKSIFEEDFRRPNNPTDVILKMSMEVDRCEQTHLDGWTRQNDTIYIGWKQPQDGWFKLNCDGAHKSSINLSGCGGLLRNSYGICVSSFARKIGSCDALHAEMWGMYIGMDLARRQGITHLQVESDSKVLVDMVTGNCKVNGRIPTLIRRIRDLKTLDWQVQINHTWREGNRSADWLANFSLTLDSFDLHIVETPPRELRSLIFDDLSGACMPRSVRLVP
jgi:ribonuclease HI